MPIYGLRWVRPGSVTWEDWWLRRYGHARSADPDLAQHVSFANYDLNGHGYPGLRLDADVVSIEVAFDAFPEVLEIVRRHGFEFDAGIHRTRTPETTEHPGPPAATIVDFIENFYSLPIDDVVARAGQLDEADQSDFKRWQEETQAQVEAEAEAVAEQLARGASAVVLSTPADEHPDPPSFGNGLGEFLRAEEFLELHKSQWLPNVAPPPLLPLGELRPFFSRSRPTSFTNDSYRSGDSLDPITTGGDLLATAVPRADTKEVKALLLYAHSVVINDPFVARDATEWAARRFKDDLWMPQMIGGYYQRHRATSSLAERPPDFVDALRLIANLAPLVRTGVAFMLPPAPHDSLYYGDQQRLLSRIAHGLSATGVVRHPLARNRDTQQISMIVAQRAIDQVRALLAFGSTGSNFLAGEFDGIGLSALLDEMIAAGSIDASLVRRDAEDRRLTQLSELALPGVDGLRVRDINRIRDSDAFGNFRIDVRESLRDLGGVESDSIEFREAMRAAANRLGIVSRRTTAWQQMRDSTVAWGLGALAGWSVEDWRTSVLGQTIGLTAYATVKTFGSTPRAVRNHYVAVQ